MKLNKSHRDRILETLSNPYDRADENPIEFTDEMAPEDQVETSIPGTSLDLAGNFVDVLSELPDVTNSQRRIAYLLSRNKAAAVVAAQCGCSAAYVKMLKRDPRIKRLVEVFRGGEIYSFVDRISPQEVLDLAATRAAEVLAEKMNMALSEETQIRAALAILDKTGHGGKDKEAPVQINIGSDVLAAYQSARKEAGMDNVMEAEIVVEP